MSKNISFNDFATIIVKAIENEPYLNKEALVPKIKALAHSFKLNFNANSYRDIADPTIHQKQLRLIEQKDFEQLFWQRTFRKQIGDEEFFKQCEKLNSQLIEYGFRDK